MRLVCCDTEHGMCELATSCLGCQLMSVRKMGGKRAVRALHFARLAVCSSRPQPSRKALHVRARATQLQHERSKMSDLWDFLLLGSHFSARLRGVAVVLTSGYQWLPSVRGKLYPLL